MSGIIHKASVSPAAVEAGQTTRVEIGLAVGPAGLGSGGMLLLDCPGYLGASRPQFHYSENEGYVVVRLSDPDVRWRGGVTDSARRRWLFEGKDYKGLEPKALRNFRLLALIFPGGVPGRTTMTIELGGSGGGFTPGYKTGTVAPRPDFVHRFILSVFPGIDAPEPLESHTLEQQVRAQPPVRACLIHKATAGSCLVARDIFGNPAALPAPLTTSTPYVINSHGTAEFASPPADLAIPVPLSRSAAMTDVADGYNLYWGDLHLHSAFSGDVKSAERNEMTPLDNFRFGKEAACLDFMAVTDHHYVGPGHERQRLSEDEWRHTLMAVAAFDGESGFVAIPGIEHQNDRGDQVVLFAESPAYSEISEPGTEDLRTLWKRLRRREPLAIAHFHNPGELPEGQWYQADDPALDPVIEVFSCHGRFDEPSWDGMPLSPPRVKLLRPDRNAAWLLARGYRYGVICNSDDHKGRPGSNGLTAVFSRGLTRRDIFEALRARRCYGTTNARIRLVFTLNGLLMGGVLRGVRHAAFRVSVDGTAALQRVDVLRNGVLHRRFSPSVESLDERWSQPVAGGGEYFQVRVLQADQEMAFSSPIWID